MSRRTDPGSETWSDEADLVGGAPGDVVARYKDAETLGHGNIGVVKLVHDRKLGRRVAYKQLKAAPSASAVARFLREATITAQLDHPGIVAVHDIGRQPDGTRYYTMRWVRGLTLAERMKAATTNGARLALIAHYGDLCQAVGYAHSKRVIHRDLKPANVMVGDFGETQILDWGLAKSLDDGPDEEVSAISPVKFSGEIDATAAGALLGTPAYMSPEQAQGEPADARSDVFALGVILYELLSGQRPFQGADAFQVVEQVRKGARAPLRDVAPDAPAELVAIAEKAMSRDPEDRYADARALAADIAAWMTGAPVSALTYSPWARLRRWASAYRLPLAVAGTAVAALGLAGTVSFAQIVAERNRALAAEQEAKRGLRDLYADHAVEAFTDGRFADATLLAVASLSYGENADARGLLLSAAGSRWPRIVGTLESPCNDADFLDEHHVACATSEGVLLWDLAHGAVSRTPLASAWVVTPWPTGGAVVFSRTQEAIHLQVDGTSKPFPNARLGAEHLYVAVDDRGRFLDAAGSTLRLVDPSGWIVSSGIVPRGPLSGAVWHRRRGFAVGSMSSPVWLFDEITAETTPLAGTVGLAVRDLAWAHSGDGLAVGTTDGLVSVVFPEGDRDPLRFESHPGPINSLVWTRDDALLLSADEAGDIAIDRVADQSRIARFAAPTATRLRTSPGGRLLAFDGNQPLARVFEVGGLAGDPATLRTVGDGLAMAGFLPDGDVVGFYGSGYVRRWRRDGARDEVRLSDALVKVGDVAPDGRFVAAGITDGDILILEPDLTERLRVEARGVTGLAITDDAAIVVAAVRALAEDSHSQVLAIDARTGAIRPLGARDHGPRDLDTRGSRVAFVDLRGHAHALDLVTGAAWEVDIDAREVAFVDPDLVLLTGDDGTVATWRLSDGAVSPRVIGGEQPHRAPIDGLAVSRDGARVATASWDQTVAVWDRASGRLLAVLRGHTNRVADVAFSADGDRLVTASWDGTLRLWDLTQLGVDPAPTGARVSRETGLVLREGRVEPGPGVRPP